MKPIKLSICIIALVEREPNLSVLINQLVQQPRFDECELIVIYDSGNLRPGDKRNRTLEAARGDYVCCIDDDDRVAPDYIPRILEAIDTGADAVAIRGNCVDGAGTTVAFDYRLDGEEGEWIGNTIWRYPGHLCPIKREIAKRATFPSVQRGEDLTWSSQLRDLGLIKSLARATTRFPEWSPLKDGALYFYQLDNYKLTPRKDTTIDPGLSKRHEAIFTPQYIERSGPGSTLEFSRPYRDFVDRFIQNHGIASILDLGCGDGVVGMNIPLSGAEYIGVDVIKDRIERNREKYCSGDRYERSAAIRPYPHMFAHGDLRTFPLDFDLVLCKDVLQHWSTHDVCVFLDRLRANRDRFRFALITNCNYGPTVNTEIETGGWRALDLTKPPFSIGEVVYSWGNDETTAGYKNVVLIKGRG